MFAMAFTTLACSQPRYVVITEPVAAAGAGSATEFAAPETETIRGRVIRLDTKTGEMVVVSGVVEGAPDGEIVVASFRVLSPEETKLIHSLKKNDTYDP